MITGVSAVAPSGDGAPVRIAVSTAASSTSTSSSQAAAGAVAVAKPEASSGGSSPKNADAGDRAATGTYLASLLAAQITGRTPTESRPVKITPERLASLISYLESAVASTDPERSEEAAVDVKS